MQQVRVLVTGVGAIIGYGIVESIRMSKRTIFIVGQDINEENYGKYKCDEFIQCPFANDPGYVDFLKDVIGRYNIDLVIPGIEQDLQFFNLNRELFDVKIVLNRKELIELSLDKWEMHNFLETSKCSSLIPTYVNLNFQEAVESCGLPFIVKPKRSYASKGFYIIHNREKYDSIINEIDQSTIFQPHIGSIDEEYTVSLFGTGNGFFADKIIMRRYLSSAGASEKVFTVPKDDAIEKALEELVKILEPVGPTNFQFRKEGQNVFLLEVNPRISSSCSLRTKFGYNDPIMSIDFFLMNKNPLQTQKKSGKAIRFISDFVLYE